MSNPHPSIEEGGSYTGILSDGIYHREKMLEELRRPRRWPWTWLPKKTKSWLDRMNARDIERLESDIKSLRESMLRMHEQEEAIRARHRRLLQRQALVGVSCEDLSDEMERRCKKEVLS